MTTEPGGLDVKAALATIDRGFSYTAPLQRRTEGIAWILFGLVSSLFIVSFAWFWQSSEDPHFRWLIVWLAGYAFLATGPALLTWRVASVVAAAFAMDARRVAMSVVVLAVGLVTVYYAIWIVLGESSDQEAIVRLIVALHIVLFGSAAWAALGIAQWTRMSQAGRRDTMALGAAMAAAGFLGVYAFGASIRTFDTAHPDFAAAQNIGGIVFVVAFGLVPLLAGLWRLAKG